MLSYRTKLDVIGKTAQFIPLHIFLAYFEIAAVT